MVLQHVDLNAESDDQWLCTHIHTKQSLPCIDAGGQFDMCHHDNVYQTAWLACDRFVQAQLPNSFHVQHSSNRTGFSTLLHR